MARKATKKKAKRRPAGPQGSAKRKKPPAKPAKRPSAGAAAGGRRAAGQATKRAGKPAKPRDRRVAKQASRPVRAPGPAKRSSKPPAQLSSKDIEQFRVALLAKRAQLVGDVNAMQGQVLTATRKDASGDLSSMPIHMADLGTDNYELEFTLGLIEGGRALLQEIDEALERIRNGTYGTCLATGQPIGKARLHAKPWAKYCYEYTLAQESGQRFRS